MESTAVKLLLLVVGAVIVEAIRHTAEFIKRITRKIEYRVSPGIPVKVDNRYLCGYELKISNTSRKKVEAVTFHLRSRNDSLQTEVTSKPDGFEFNSTDKDGGVDLHFPRFKQGEVVAVKIQTENKHLFSDSLGISVSSPNDVEGKRIADADIGRARRSPSRIPAAFIAGLLFAWIVSKTVAWNSDKGHDQDKQQQTAPTKFSPDQKDTIVSLAAVVGLPHFAELYFSAPGPIYYDEGDLSYALAAESNKTTEIEKYRRLISLTLGTVKDMAPESQANLFYSMGKLDLLLSDKERAASDFKSAIAKSREIVEAQAKADTKTHKYLIDSGLL